MGSRLGGTELRAIDDDDALDPAKVGEAVRSAAQFIREHFEALLCDPTLTASAGTREMVRSTIDKIVVVSDIASIAAFESAMRLAWLPPTGSKPLMDWPTLNSGR